MKESEVGARVLAYLKRQGWKPQRDVSGRNARGPDLIMCKNETVLYAEVKGNAGDDGLDFKTAIGQLVMNKCIYPDGKHALAFPEEGYITQVDKCATWFTSNEVAVFLVTEAGRVKRRFS